MIFLSLTPLQFINLIIIKIIIKYYNIGLSMRKISKITSIPKSTVNWMLNKTTAT